jgi:uncharacterized protein YjiS (DUF1127 family)
MEFGFFPGLVRSGEFQMGDHVTERASRLACAIDGTRQCIGFVAAIIVEWRRRRRSRLELMARSDRELWDLAMTRDAAEVEAGKPFWRE